MSRSTLRLYAMLWDSHILPRLGDLKLRELTAETLQQYRLDLQAAGVGQASVRKALVLLQRHPRTKLNHDARSLNSWLTNC